MNMNTWNNLIGQNSVTVFLVSLLIPRKQNQPFGSPMIAMVEFWFILNIFEFSKCKVGKIL